MNPYPLTDLHLKEDEENCSSLEFFLIYAMVLKDVLWIFIKRHIEFFNLFVENINGQIKLRSLLS